MMVFLVGMMGSGKSSIGKNLAKILSYKFLDTDQEIENKHRNKISKIFEEAGEDTFRQMEKDLLNELNYQENIIVATGGGFPCYGNNMEVMNKMGVTVYLEAVPAFLASRLIHAKNERPLIASFNDEELLNYLENLLSKREGYYQKSKFKISAKNLKAQDLVEMIMKS